MGATHVLNMFKFCNNCGLTWHCLAIFVDPQDYTSTLPLHGPQLCGYTPVDNVMALSHGLGDTVTIALNGSLHDSETSALSSSLHDSATIALRRGQGGTAAITLQPLAL